MFCWLVDALNILRVTLQNVIFDGETDNPPLFTFSELNHHYMVSLLRGCTAHQVTVSVCEIRHQIYTLWKLRVLPR